VYFLNIVKDLLPRRIRLFLTALRNVGNAILLRRGIGNTLRGVWQTVALSLREIVPSKQTAVTCNLCSWEGAAFYPNFAPSYFERDCTCPQCGAIARYRSLLVLLRIRTDCFHSGRLMLEIAPTDFFQNYCLRHKAKEYLSIDPSRPAILKGNIACLPFKGSAFDYVICLHVFGYVRDDYRAASEVSRVLKPRGVAIVQVAIDCSLEKSVEHLFPDRYDCGHIRRYSESDFERLWRGCGFHVQAVSVDDLLPVAVVRRYRLDHKPFLIATKVR